MLEANQKTAIQKLLELGFNDVQIAQDVPGVNKMQVFNYRHKLKVSTTAVTQRRYDVWMQLLYQGHTFGFISHVYGVQEESIKVLLLKHRGLSLLDLRATLAQKNAKSLQEGPGIPHMADLGLSLPPLCA